MTKLPLSLKPNLLLPEGRILVLTANPYRRYIYSRTLREAGHKVYLAEVPAEAEILVETIQFDVIIWELSPGESFSRTALDRLNAARPGQRSWRVIIVWPETRARSVCKIIGIDAVLEQPVRLDVLVGLVNRMLLGQPLREVETLGA